MSREKIEGFLIGFGAGVLVAALMDLGEEAGKSARDHSKGATEHIDDAPERVSTAPAAIPARAARA